MNFKTVIIFIFAIFLINESRAQKEGVYVEAEILEGWVPNFNKLSRTRPVNSGNVTVPERIKLTKLSKYGAPAPASPLGGAKVNPPAPGGSLGIPLQPIPQVATTTTRAVLVTVNLYVREMRFVSHDNDYSVQLTFRQQWRDERLSYSSQVFLNSSRPYVTLINSENEIWQPDIFFSNEVEGKYHELMMKNEYFRISPDGSVLKSDRITLRLSCPRDYRNFPFDTQTCSLRLASYAFTTEDLVFRWKAVDPVQVTSNLEADTTNLLLIPTQFTTDYCDSQTNTGIYSCLRIDFTFQRAFHSYLIMVYIPSMMMVFTSWVSFWITPKAVTARTMIATLTLFVLAIQTAEANKTFPQTSYTKPVDVWTGTCLTFVFAALLEFATVHYLSNWLPSSDKLDVVSRIVFPVLFILFNIFYWVVYTF